jgi:hypothetical protein
MVVPRSTLRSTWTRAGGRLFIDDTDLKGSFEAGSRYVWRIDVATGSAATLSSRPTNSTWELPCRQDTAIVDTSEQVPLVRIRRSDTNTQLDLKDPFLGRYPDRADPLCSDATDLIGVLRWREPEYGWPLLWTELPSTSLTVYTRDGQVYRTFNGLFARAWAPDASHRILYFKGGGFGKWYPCILDVDDGSDNCPPEIRRWREMERTYTATFSWTPDATSISFSYWGSGPQRAGICIFNIETRLISCPITESDLPAEYFIRDHMWSPDGKYINFTIDLNYPAGDFLPDPHLVTAAADGTNLKVWTFYASSPQWRPNP